MMIKMFTYDENWVVKDGDRIVVFDKAYDAWCYIFLLREIRPKAPFVQRSLYPVKSLNPIPERRIKNVKLHS